MALWKIRNPDYYPAWYHKLVRVGWENLTEPEAQSTFSIEFPEGFPTRELAVTVCRKFRAFRMNLRNFPHHNLHQVERDFALKTRIVEDEMGWKIILTMYRKGLEGIPDRFATDFY